VTEFLDWVSTLIPKDKFNIFASLFKFPTPIVKLTGKIYGELERVFDGRNASFNYQFSKTDLKDDFLWYRREVLHEPTVWRTLGWQKMKTAINSILIVDLPSVQTTERPEPYFYFLDISSVIDYRWDGMIRWIIFHQKDTIACFDEYSYRIFSLDDKGNIADLISEQAHNLGYCPAQFFWTTPLANDQQELKKAPISEQLGDMDWLLFFAISKRHLDLYAPYPIYSAYARACNFQNGATGDYCDGGFLRDRDGNYKTLRTGTVEQCPVCGEKVMAGAGSFVEVPIPKTGEGGIPDLKSPVQITTVDFESLNYNVRERERLEDEIFNAVIGIGGKVIDKEAVNQEQIAASFEGKTSVLINLKMNFEKAQKFVEDTVCKLRYGEDFLNSGINWGTEFYVYSVTELQDLYKKAKDNGVSAAQLDAINEQIISTENRTNPLHKERMIILKQLEPFTGYTLDQVLSMYEKGLISEEMMIIKINFISFVERFERENTNITDFGRLQTLETRVNTINQKFKEYASEQKQQVEGKAYKGNSDKNEGADGSGSTDNGAGNATGGSATSGGSTTGINGEGSAKN